MTLHATTTNPATIPEEPAPRAAAPRSCVCPVCGTDEFLVLRHVWTCRLPGRKDTTGWDVDYRCSNCGRGDEHLTGSLPADWDI